MSSVLNTNVPALLAQRNLSIHTGNVERSMERLSSGYRINRAADDAAGLSISQNLRSQIRRMQQAVRNTQDGISILQVAEGAISTIGDNLQRIRELTVQAANDNNSPESRDAIETEIQALLNDIDRIAQSTEFNNQPILDGTLQLAGGPATIPIQIGPNSTFQTNVMDLRPALQSVLSGDPVVTGALGQAAGSGLGIVGGAGNEFGSIAAIDFVDNDAAQGFLSDIDAAIDRAVAIRSSMGSFQNQLESVIFNLNSSIENLSASDSRIRDLDIARETADLAKHQVLQNASVGVLGQANKLPQMILGLLEAR